MKTSLQLFIVLFGLFGFAQEPALQWQKALGGFNSDYGNCIQQTTDGGYIVASQIGPFNNGDVTGSHGATDAWVTKLDNLGAISWQKALGGIGADRAYSIEQTTDGGYIVAGSSNSNDGDVTGNHGGDDAWIIKLDNLGVISWQKSLGGTGNEYANCIQQTIDGGYIVAGYSSSNNGDVTGNHGVSDAWVVKLDNLGIIVWQRALGGTNGDSANSIKQTTDGGYVIAGETVSNNGDVSGYHNSGYSDAWIVKLNNLGAISWQKALGGVNTDFASSIQQTIDGGYIVAGTTSSNDGDVSGNHSNSSSDIWIVKLDSLGTISWQKALGGTSGEQGYSIQLTIDGGYIVAGNSSSNDGDVSGNHSDNSYSDLWVVKLNNLGTISWQKALGGTHFENANSIKQTTDGGYIVAGNTTSNDGDVSGNHSDSYSDVWVAKLGPDLGTESFGNENTFLVYPNPAANVINVKTSANSVIQEIVITDVLGKKVFQSNKNTTVINVEDIQKGMYFIEITSEGKINYLKFLKE